MIKQSLFAILVFFAALATAQNDIYPIKIDPIERTQPKPRGFSAKEETNWGRTICAPDAIVAKAITMAKHKVHVHILDTGEPNHILLQSGKTPGVNMTNESIADGNSHSTHVTGIVAAKGFGLAQALADNGLLTWQCDKVLTNAGNGTFNWIYQVLDNQLEKDKQKIESGVSVIYSGSLGADVAPITGVESSLKRLTDAGGIAVFASGNSGTAKVGYPASSPYAIGVSSLDENLTVSNFSSTGPEVWAAAPGRNISSTIPGNLIGKKSGTSMACPGQTALIAWAKAIWGPAIPNHDYMRRYMGWCAVDILPSGKDPASGWGLSLLDNITKKDPKKMPVDFGKTPPPPPPPVPDPTRTERTLTFLLEGSWKLSWGLNVAAGEGDEPQFLKSIPKAQKAEFEKLEINYIEFTAPTAYYWKKASKDARATMDWYFYGVGMLMPSPSDEHDVVRWLSRFFEMITEKNKKMSGIRVKALGAKGANGETILIREADLEHFPRN